MDFNQWLEREGLSLLAEVFAANHIDDVEILADLNDAELEAIGIPIGSRKKIQRALAGQGFRSDEAQAAAPQAAPPESTPPPIQDQLPPAPQTQDQQPVVPAVPAEAPQQVEPQPASPVATLHLSHPASPPQAQAVQATRHQPKAKNGRKATAVMIAVGVHVALILLAATLTIFRRLQGRARDHRRHCPAFGHAAAGDEKEDRAKAGQARSFRRVGCRRTDGAA